jgi:hypothetical protein
MAINRTQLKGIKIDKDKDRIIQKYNNGIKIHILADKYNVGVDTIARRLRNWGMKVNKGDYRRKVKIRKHWYRKFSKEFLANRAEITRMNHGKIKYIKDADISHSNNMIRNILKHV